MSTIEDFENAPIGSVARIPGTSNTMVKGDPDLPYPWADYTSTFYSNEEVFDFGYILDSSNLSDSSDSELDEAGEKRPTMSTPSDLLTPEELADFKEVTRLLEEVSIHDLEQRGEGELEGGDIYLRFRNGRDQLGEVERKSPSVSIHSYLIGPQRNYLFQSIRQALEFVREWHKDKMGQQEETS